LGGCVSINIPKSEAVKASNIQFSPPSTPYIRIDLDELDNTWKNPSNGNTISFLSNCNDPSDPSLKGIRTEIIARIENSKIENESYFNYNNRGALRSQITGRVEGVSTQFDVVILKKNSCIYIINYVGSEKSYQVDLETFNNFIEGFKVQ
tara:strand:+ start:29626 stop:30075 length:450 start_codon:yes stop_codon:yes gene_type:complete